MNVLWITNTLFPGPSKALGFPPPTTGGWMYGLAEQVAGQPGIRLAVATTYFGQEVRVLEIDGIRYYLLPAKSRITYQASLEPFWLKLCGEFKPDVVHIHGTEFPHGLACMRACPDNNYVVSIQGLVSIISDYYLADISPGEILTHVTLRDLIRNDTIYQSRRTFRKRGRFEKECLQRTMHVIGRTTWDYVHTKSINPTLAYHFCDESLRDGFYSAAKWDIRSKSNHTIFLSQAGYPIKGAHQVLKALSLLKGEFPHIKVRIAGSSIIRNTTLSEKLRLSGYGKYLLDLMKRNDLHDSVHFLGCLNELQMIDEYRHAHLFICPSSIENSPNSLGEAQLLGTPCVASYVGGVSDMVVHGETGLLYRFEEIHMMAECIRRVFTDDILAVRLSVNGIAAAEQRHDRQTNLAQILTIYSKVCS